MQEKRTEPIPVDTKRGTYIFRVSKINNEKEASIPRQKTPTSVTIPATDEIMLWDEDAEMFTPTRIRYSTQERSILFDKQSDSSKDSIIEIGKVGFVELDTRRNATLISYLLNCNYNSTNKNRVTDKKEIFIEVRLEEAEDAFVAAKKRATEAVSYVFGMDEQELRDYAQAIGRKVVGVQPSRLRAELTAYAERYTDMFFENLESPEFEIIVKVNKAFTSNIIVNNGGAIKLVSANRIILSIPAGASAPKELAHYFLSERGKDDWAYVAKKIESIEESKSAIKAAYKPSLGLSAKVTVEAMSALELFENCSKAGVIERKAPYYYYGEDNLGKGKDGIYQKIDEDESFRKQLQADLALKM